ncbi:hypothetical protein [Belnapia moabensis]|uniref:hypothetical protein n=1 Tax=Belnapia moabensis TaxID=365533 RepID=UPI0005B7FF01|nr:hypothetical protein [Belnapia moabensis]
MPTVSFFYSKDLVAIRKTVAPAARWDAASKTWSMSGADAAAFVQAASAVFLDAAIDVDGVPVHEQVPGANPEYRILRCQDLGASLSILVDGYDHTRRLIIRPRDGQSDPTDLAGPPPPQPEQVDRVGRW